MIVVTGHVRFAPEKIAGLRPHIRAVLEATRKEPGCLVYAYAEDFLEPGLLRIVERWENWPALEAHGTMPTSCRVAGCGEGSGRARPRGHRA